MKTGRVTEAHRTNLVIKTDDARELLATVRGNFHSAGDFPKVGDYVQFSELDDDKAVIESIEERKSVIKRKTPDEEEEQILVTNIDLMLIVMGLDGDYSINRLERYLLLAKQSNIPAVVVLNKSDVVDNAESFTKEVQTVAGESPVLVVSALQGDGMEGLWEKLVPDTTAVLLGSSGAGKSTIVNWLLETKQQAVQDIRADDSKGRHTTTTRQLFKLKNGSYLIDTPGIRELGMASSESDAPDEIFAKINNYAAQCKFRNCDHAKSDGCAVLAAVESGDITEREFNNYHKLLREMNFAESKTSPAAARHQAQTEKRNKQKQAAVQKEKLKRRLGG